MNLDFTTRVIAPSHVLVQEIEGQSALLNINSERYFGIDDVGTRMWAVMTSAPSLQQAYESLLAEYEVDGTQLQDDLRKFLEQLVEHDLVRVETPMGSSEA